MSILRKLLFVCFILISSQTRALWTVVDIQAIQQLAQNYSALQEQLNHFQRLNSQMTQMKNLLQNPTYTLRSMILREFYKFPTSRPYGFCETIDLYQSFTPSGSYSDSREEVSQYFETSKPVFPGTERAKKFKKDYLSSIEMRLAVVMKQKTYLHEASKRTHRILEASQNAKDVVSLLRVNNQLQGLMLEQLFKMRELQLVDTEARSIRAIGEAISE